jgi:hypothetical protein
LKVRAILIEGLKTEDDSNNRQLLLWTICSYLYENIEFPELKDFPHTLTQFLLNRVTSNAWSQDDSLHALGILSELTNIFQFIRQYNKDTAPQLVHMLAAFIEASMEEKKGQNLPEALIVKSFYCILDWIMADWQEQWFLQNPVCMKTLLKTIEIAATGARVSRLECEQCLTSSSTFQL